MSLLITWLVAAVAVWATAALLPGFTVRGIKGALVVAALLGLLQALLGKVLFAAIGIATLGLGFLLAFVTRCVVTALLLVVVDKLADSLKIRNFGTALLGALVISVFTSVIEAVMR